MKNIDALSWIGTIKDIELLEFFESLKDTSTDIDIDTDVSDTEIDEYIRKYDL